MRAVCLLLVLLPVFGAAAQSSEYGAQAVVQRAKLVATHHEDPTAAGTSLDLTNRVSLPRSLGDVIQEAPGARVLKTGGLGSVSTVSLRGSDTQEVMVMLDEIPLTTADGGAFDLSLFAPELFQRIDVFRGGSPVWLGSGAIGGVVRLVPVRDPRPQTRLSVGGGSFGLYQLGAGATAGDEQTALIRSNVVVRGARNDYPYLDDKGTRFDASDDQEFRRKNAQLSDASGFTDLTMPMLGGKLHVLAMAQGRTAGFPGPGSQPTPNIHDTVLRTITAAAYERVRGGAGGRTPRSRLQLVASNSYDLSRHSDYYGELGTSSRWETNDKAYRGFFRLAGSLRVLRWLTATVVSSYALDRTDRSNRFSFPKPAPSMRHTAAAALELSAKGHLGRVGFALNPSARVEWSRTELHASRGIDGAFDSTRNLTVPTARVGAGILPFEEIALTGSIATGTRLPTMFELFGDRGLVLPALGLKPVTSTTFDGGLAWCTKRERWGVSSDLHGFLQKRRDAIASLRTAQFQTAHENLSEVEQRGAELGFSGSLLDTFSLNGSLTYLDTNTQLDKRLPFRPQWVSFVRPQALFHFSGVVSSVGAAAELYFRSFVFVDRANLATVADCQTSGVSMSVGFLRDRLRVMGRMDDAADRRCSDLVGYPLPGRNVFFSLSYHEEQS